MSAVTPQESPDYIRLYPILEDEEKDAPQATPSRSLPQLNGRIQVNLERPEEVEDACCRYLRFGKSTANDSRMYCCLIPAPVAAIVGSIIGKAWITYVGGGVPFLGLCAWGVCKHREITKICHISEALFELLDPNSPFANHLRGKGIAQVSEDELVQFYREFIG